MVEYIVMLVVGILFLPLGIMNIKGNISSIHWYNRTRITEETRPKYGKLVGTGTIIIGGGIILSAISNMLIKMNVVVLISGIITLASVIIGLVFILYAQFKYNKGIF